jgi:tRNA A-37 threonylcarbamoyl transferase component Bud32
VSRDELEPAASADSLLREIARAPEVSISERARGGRLGPYELIAPIGAGGMGEVYRARDSRLGRDVAIKILPREYADSEDRRRRFESEARAAAAVDHPNVLVVHDAGTEGGTPYIVFELLEGETLRRRLARGALPVAQAVELAAQIAHGLAAAHARGITHRDLKPDNIFVTPGDRAKILDFGLAKTARTDGVASTAPGTVLGTAGYMSPEQVRGEALDQRTDLFALGAILYEALAGRPSFDGRSAVDVMHAILNDEPPPLATVPAPVERIVRRCLVKDRGERYQSAHDLAFQLDGLGAPVTPAVAAKRPRLAGLAIAAAIAAPVAGVVGYLAGRRGEPATAPRESAPISAPTAAPPAEDRHWIQSDDYFIAEEPWDHGWMYVHLAKLRQAATATSRDAKFFQLGDAREVWTAAYWRTRPAEATDLTLGTFAICFNDNTRDGVYLPPPTKDAARTQGWFLGKLTDTSDLRKGWVRVDSYNCAVDGIRVALP